ncbi:MAG TPA: site-specific integrase [Candidatus Acidoferrum sp.]|nr:site-specific integrase [Candidatus Acidoferrum sp.]
MTRRAKGEGSLIRRKGCRYWYASFYDAFGKQVRTSTKKTGKMEALAELRRLMGDSERGLPVANGKVRYAELRAALIQDYVDSGNKTLELRSDGTETIVGLRPLDMACGYKPAKDGLPEDAGMLVSAINVDWINKFKAKRVDDGVGPAMINRSLQALRRGLNLLRENGKIAVVPKVKLKKEPPARKGWVEQADFERLLAALPTYLRPLIAFMYYTGVRKGEALSIEWPQVDLNAGTITVEEEQAKNEEPRVLPLPSEVLATLRDREHKQGRVFDGTNLRTEWEIACAAVGLGTRTLKQTEHERKDRKKPRTVSYKWHEYRGLRLHDLRRSAVRNLIRAGVSQKVAMDISGHKTTNVFQRYNITSPKDVLAAMRLVEVAAAKALPPVSAKSVQKRQPKSIKTLQVVKSKGTGA